MLHDDKEKEALSQVRGIPVSAFGRSSVSSSATTLPSAALSVSSAGDGSASLTLPQIAMEGDLVETQSSCSQSLSLM